MDERRRASSTIDRYYQALADRDRAALEELLHPDLVVVYHAQPEHFPWSGSFEGIDGFHEFLSRVAAVLDVVHVRRREPIEDDRFVVVPCEGRWRVRATGVDVVGSMLNLYAVDDGRITRYEVYADTAAFRDALS